MRPTLKRPHIVQTALNDAELAAARKKADAEGLSMTAFIRQLIIKNVMGGPIDLKTPSEPDQRVK